jgi:1-acyl-sn-glycerol-3-phosphate acyltransferase
LPLYRVVRWTFRAVAWPMFRFRVEGFDHLPSRGAAVLVAPHRSWLDPACVGGACPRPVRFLILDSVYQKRWARWFYQAMESVPVQPDGRDSVAAIRTALRLLSRGELVGVFPEGRVFPEGSGAPLHPGAALLSLRSRAPVIPLWIQGSARAWPHGKRLPRPAPIRVCIGPPIAPPPRERPGAIEEHLGAIASGLERLRSEAAP